MGYKLFRFDYAFLTTTKSDDVTTLGYDFSGVVPSNEHIYFAGYPADTEEGLKLISSSGLRNPGIRALLHVPQNPLTSGSAGGPWLIRHSDDNYQVIGVASHGQPAQGVPGAFSPVLDAETKRILKAAERAIETVSTPTRESEEQSSETVPSEPDA